MFNNKNNQNIKSGDQSVNIQIGEIVFERKNQNTCDFEAISVFYANSLLSSFFKEKTLLGRIIDLTKEYVSLKAIEKHSAANILEDAKDDYIVLSQVKTVDITVDELLSWNIHTLIVSGAGTGKTTLLKHIAYLLCKSRLDNKGSTIDIPVYVSLKQLELSKLNIDEYIISKCTRFLPSNIDNTVAVNYWLLCGNISILLDGFDEVMDEISDTISKVITFNKKYPLCRMILASRPTLEDLHIFQQAGFKEVGVAPLTKSQKFDFCKTYLYDIEKAKKLADIIDENDHLRAISMVPIYLILIISLYEENIELTSSNNFYSESCRLLLSIWPKKKGLALKYSTNEKYTILSKLSFFSIKHRVNLSHRLILHVFEDAINPEIIFDEIVETSGMLRPIGYEKYEFIHKTFMEYFAALYINQSGFSCIDENLNWLVVNSYVEVFAFLCDMLNDSTELLGKLIDNKPNPYLISLCLSKSKKVNIDKQISAEKFLLDCFQVSSSLYTADSDENKALKIMHCFPVCRGYKNLYEQFIDMLINPDSYINKSGIDSKNHKESIIDVKTEALCYLVHNHCRGTAKLLLDELLNTDNEIWVKFKAASALSYLSNDSIILPHLMRAYSNEEQGDDDVRIMIIEAIIRSASKNVLASINFLNKITEIDDSSLARELSREGIRNIGSENTLVDKVIIDYSDDRYLAIKRIYHQNILIPIELIEYLLDENYPRRLDVCYILRDARPGFDLSPLALARLLYNNNQSEVFKCEIVKILGMQGTSAANTILLDYYLNFALDNKDTNQYSRGYAVEYLGYNKCYFSLMLILKDKRLKSRKDNERNKAIWSIAEMLKFAEIHEYSINNTEARSVLTTFLNDPYGRVRHWAKIAIDLCR